MENITLLIGDLETLFPARPQQASLIGHELKELHDQQHLKLLAATAQGVDEALRRGADEALSAHQYRNIQVKGKAHNGDVFDDHWQRGVIGKAHTYDGVVVDAGGKVVNGNQYGGKSFWDD
jgi:hypothetical protein